MNKETHEKKSIRIGYRSAYGACDKHKNHGSLGDFVLGFLVAGCLMISGLAVYSGLNTKYVYTTGYINCVSQSGTSITETRPLSKGIYLTASDGVACTVDIK